MKAIASSRNTSTPRLARAEDDVGVLAEDLGVGPVDVPLVVVEGRPHPGGEVVVPGEVAGREVGKDLRQGRLVGVGHLPVVVDVEVGTLALVTRTRRRRPRVLTRDVVEHQVEAEADALLAQGRGERAEVVDGAEVGAHGAVVHDGVAAVVGRRSRRQQRHQVEVAHAQVAQVGRALADVRQACRRTGRRRRRSPPSRVAGTSRARATAARRARAGRRVARRARRARSPPAGRSRRLRQQGRRPARAVPAGRAATRPAGPRSRRPSRSHESLRDTSVPWGRAQAPGRCSGACVRHRTAAVSRRGAPRSRCRRRARWRGRS